VADYLAEHWAGKEIAILDDGTVWGAGVANAVRRGLHERGVAVTVDPTRRVNWITSGWSRRCRPLASMSFSSAVVPPVARDRDVIVLQQPCASGGGAAGPSEIAWQRARPERGWRI
jgi:hypothetical protein